MPNKPETFYLFDHDGLPLKVGVTTRGKSAALRDAKRMHWWAEVDPARTVITAYPTTAAAKQAADEILARDCPRHNVAGRKVSPVARAAPLSGRSRPLAKLARRADEAESALAARTTPRIRGVIYPKDRVFSLYLNQFAVVGRVSGEPTDPLRRHTVHTATTSEIAFAADLLTKPFPHDDEIARIRAAWLADNLPSGWPDPNPPHEQARAAARRLAMTE